MAVYHLRRERIPPDTVACLRKILSKAEGGLVTGMAFVVLLDGHGFISDTCGQASNEIDEVRLMLKTLDTKLAKRQLARRSSTG